MTDKQQLWMDYTQHHSETAFRELFSRYVNLVYSAALRLVDGDEHRAKDVSQIVFADLAKNAGELPPAVMLGGWLHRHTCFVAANVMRGERRRATRERKAMEMNLLENAAETDYSRFAPLLDETLNQLDGADRAAILLRFFEQKDFRTVGEMMASSEDAARMRVNRALEKLRDLLAQRGVRTTAGALGIAITANAVQAAPVGLAITISAAALAGTAATTSTLIAATTKTIAMTTLQKTLVTATIAVLAGAGIYEARQAALLHDQVESLEQQTPLLEHVQKLQSEREDATSRLAGLTNELATSKKNNLELLRLRGEVGLLRQQTNRLGQSVHALSTTLSAANSLGSTLEQTNLPRESWTFAGLATPENALQSYMWAKSRGDVATAFATATPELVQEIKSFYFKDKSDEEISALLAGSAKNQLGIQILKKMVAADDQIIFQVHVDGESEKSYTLLTMKKMDNEWKVSSVEERPAENPDANK